MQSKQRIIRAVIAIAWAGFCFHTFVFSDYENNDTAVDPDDGEKLHLRRQLSGATVGIELAKVINKNENHLLLPSDPDAVLPILPMSAVKARDVANKARNDDPETWIYAAEIADVQEEDESTDHTEDEEEHDQDVTTVSIHLTTGGMNPTRSTPGHSFFNTGMTERYGSGRVKYDIYHYADNTVNCNPTRVEDVLWQKEEGVPCLAASHENDKYNMDDLKCAYPGCKTMIISDEYCGKGMGADIRHYQSDNLEGLFLPLGPRYDSWQSFMKIHQDPKFTMPLASERKYAFNAIYTKSTSQSRRNLSRTISEIESHIDNMNIFTHISKRYTWKPNDSNSEQLDTDHYVQVLYDSTFTLTPAGHNPECYRIYEALEAGSIPIFIRDDLYITSEEQHACIGALVHLYDAPLVVLESWKDLPSTVEGLLKDPVALNAMQNKLTLWYETYMKKVVADFEDLMIGSSAVDAEEEELLETSLA